MSDWHGFYSTTQVSRLAQIPLSTLYEWQRKGIIRPDVAIANEQGHIVDHGYSYADLTIVKIMRAVSDRRLDLKSLRLAMHHLYERLGPPSKGWVNAHVYIVGGHVFAEKPDEWDVTAATGAGQRVERRLFGEMFANLRGLEEPGAILIPQSFRPYVQINPAIMGGEPVVKNTRIPTSMLAMLKERGKSSAALAQLYRLQRKFVEKAIEYERFLDRENLAAAGA